MKNLEIILIIILAVFLFKKMNKKEKFTHLFWDCTTNECRNFHGRCSDSDLEDGKCTTNQINEHKRYKNNKANQQFQHTKSNVGKTAIMFNQKTKKKLEDKTTSQNSEVNKKWIHPYLKCMWNRKNKLFEEKCSNAEENLTGILSPQLINRIKNNNKLCKRKLDEGYMYVIENTPECENMRLDVDKNINCVKNAYRSMLNRQFKITDVNELNSAINCSEESNKNKTLKQLCGDSTIANKTLKQVCMN